MGISPKKGANQDDYGQFWSLPLVRFWCLATVMEVPIIDIKFFQQLSVLDQMPVNNLAFKYLCEPKICMRMQSKSTHAVYLSYYICYIYDIHITHIQFEDKEWKGGGKNSCIINIEIRIFTREQKQFVYTSNTYLNYKNWALILRYKGKCWQQGLRQCMVNVKLVQ